MTMLGTMRSRKAVLTSTIRASSGVPSVGKPKPIAPLTKAATVTASATRSDMRSRIVARNARAGLTHTGIRPMVCAMPIKSDPRHIGRAWITPDAPVVAGQLGTWTVSYEVGAYGYDERARLKIAWRFASDWGTPQFKDPRARNYTTVRLETRCPTAVANLEVEPRGQVRPWLKTLVASVADGSLYPGDRIHITIGDQRGGSEGSRAQTFRERGCEWRVFIDPFGTELYTTLAASPLLDVVGGPLHRLVAIAPTTVRAGEPFDALVKAEDLWGNPCERFTGELNLDAVGAPLDGLPATVRWPSGEIAVARLTGLRLAGGETRIRAR